jgi:Fur family ferric uptake transcriptional regulator
MIAVTIVRNKDRPMPHCHTFIETLRQRGYRVTPQREMIIKVIAHSSRHMTAEEVFAEVQTQTRAINVATVYRTLDLLVEEGLASRADLGGGQVVYATARHGPHIHLVCRHCGAVVAVDVDSFESLFEHIQTQHGFVCGPQHFAIYGLCEDCQTVEIESDS